jgi:uncharacterized membrane protein
MTRRLVVWLLGAFLLAAVLGGIGTVAADGEQGLLVPQTERADFENVAFDIEVYANGTAEWTVRYIQPLDNESAVGNFETFAERFNTEELAIYDSFRLRAEQIASAGANATGREMTAGGFARDARVVDRDQSFGQTRGVLEMSFRWSNFAQTDGKRVVVRDVFEGGLYLGQNQRLIVSPGPTLAFVDVKPDSYSQSDPANLTASSSVTWFGQIQFSDQRPYVEFLPQASAGDAGPESPGAGDTNPGPGTNIGSLPLLVAGLVVVLAAVLGGAWYTGRLGGSKNGGTATGSVQASSDSDGGAEASGARATPAAAVPDEELLTDEDRVLQLLDENGGRMKQVTIVEETDWSKSKVSMLLSDMQDDGQISKLRLGRENIISLSGQEPDAAGSPFEDEDG